MNKYIIEITIEDKNNLVAKKEYKPATPYKTESNELDKFPIQLSSLEDETKTGDLSKRILTLFEINHDISIFELNIVNSKDISVSGELQHIIDFINEAVREVQQVINENNN